MQETSAIESAGAAEAEGAGTAGSHDMWSAESHDRRKHTIPKDTTRVDSVLLQKLESAAHIEHSPRHISHQPHQSKSKRAGEQEGKDWNDSTSLGKREVRIAVVAPDFATRVEGLCSRKCSSSCKL